MKTWLACFILMLCGFRAAGQVFPDIKFNQLTVKDGLSTNAVKCIYEDNNGIMWIATSKGLNRYDGTGFEVYHHIEDDSTSICNDALNYVTADPEHQLWVSTIGGLSRFNPNTGKAVNYIHSATDKNSLATNEKCIPYFDSKGRLWIATGNGVQLFDYKNNQFTTYNAPPIIGPDAEHVYNYFNLIREDTKHQLWALSAFGMYLIDERAHKLVLYNQHAADLNLAFHQTADGTIYLGQLKGGLKKFIPQQSLYQQVISKLSNAPDGKVNDIAEWRDDNNNNWLCIGASGGLGLIDLKSGQIREYGFDNLNTSSLHAFYVYQITKDRQNRLWLSTDNGINIIDPNLQNFENLPLYQQLQLNNPKLFGLPNNMLEADGKFYLTSYYAKGVYVFDKNWRLLKHILQVPENSTSALSKSINSIYKDDKSNLWFSTDSGLVKQSGNSYKFYFPPGLDAANKDNLTISKIYKRTDGLFWIRARQNGLYVFDPERGVFLKQYKPDGKTIDGTVFSCFLAKDGVLWVGATGGISCYVPSKDVFKKIIIKKNDGKVVPVGWITDITEDKENVIWAVSDAGLIKIKKSSDDGLLINSKSGLPENYLKRIMIDTLGNLWIPSQQGIIKYDRKKAFTFFNVNNGLPFQYEGHGFFERDSEGNFLVGFSGFVTRFNPYNIITNTAIPKVILLSISADGNRTSVSTSNNEKSITLAPGTKIVSIHFAITNYTAPQENNYYYKVGSTTQWQQVKNGNIALGSLPNGTYTLFIKGSNNDNVFSKEEKLTITVLPHWYETAVFELLCILVIIAVIIFLVRRRIAFIRNEALFKQKLIESELRAIRAQMNPHFIFNALNSIESYIMENNARTASVMIQKFAGLCRLILENSTQSLVSAAREWKALKLYAEVEAMRFNNQFAFNFICNNDVDLNGLLIPPMLVQPLIENAIHHGLRNYQKDDGLVTIELSKQDDSIRFTVTDNGIGFSAATQNQSKHILKQQSLALKSIRERIAAMNGLNGDTKASFEIKEINAPGKSGTIATLILPINLA
ncbi:Two component regulator propeller [Mucilaginibacter pineti]|uniref:Two component regulator propeller n=1 Tax=Mucilaginibacter pineti TaxID=1391627 RepID=A0A1G6XAW4_9SPHI|nr:two-component regulator propeller domain-containing protein [Mucilaginibacter pineti]SDD74376.1 Two component regulator propeller [Mucilaginibacter pineti]